MYELLDVPVCFVDYCGVCCIGADVWVEQVGRSVGLRIHAYSDGDQEVVLWGTLPDEWRSEVVNYLESHEVLQWLIRREFSKTLDREVA